ncbi:hypothetical protein ACOYW6_13295 [Parablastomonas sp. CN1-191]|uniref:hypothetical protein n=1 Tax=Parablastomonas sp. CN1-191 TaxID=3400908 RepID=UPI003BF7D8E9
MTAALDWEFIKEFHPLPNSDRRVLLKALGVDGITIFDDEQFYRWLAVYYEAGRGPEIDAVIHKKLSKADERGLLPVLYNWLIVTTGTPRRRAHDKRELVTSMAKAVVAKKGVDASRLRALAPNYPWLQLPATVGDDNDDNVAIEVKSAESELSEGVKESDRDIFDDAQIEATLSRLLAAAEQLRERPNSTLLEWAAALADAVDTHVAQAKQSELDSAQLEQRRDRLTARLSALDAVVSSRVGASSVDEISHEAVERIENALLDFDEAHRTSVLSREEMVASLDASPAEREKALVAFNASTAARDVAIEVLAGAIQRGKPDTTDQSDSVNRPAPPVPVPVEPQSEPHEEEVRPALDVATSRRDDGSQLSEAGAADQDADHPASPESEELDEDIVFDHAGNALAALESASSPDAGSDLAEAVEGSGSTAGDGPDAPDPPVAALPGWDVWIDTALRTGRLALSVHLADGQNIAGATQSTSLPRATLEGLFRGNAVQAVYSRGWAEYDELRDSLLNSARFEGVSKPSNDLLLFAGAIRPALVQSQTALAILHSLEGDVVAQLQPLRSVLEHFAGLRVDNLAQLAAAPDQAAKQARLDDVKLQIVEWQETAPNRGMNYQPATAVWLELIDEGKLGQAVRLVIGGAPNAVAEVATILEDLDSDLDRAIDDARAKLAKGVRREPIEGNARRHLKRQMTAAMDLFRHWSEARQQMLRPREDRLQVDRVQLLKALNYARDSIRALGESDPAIEVAAGVFQSVVSGVEAQLSGETVYRTHADEALDWEICLLPRFPFNSRIGFRVTADDIEDLAAAAAHGCAHSIADPEKAFETCLELEAASSARQLISRLGSIDSDTTENRLEAVIVSARKRLSDRVRSVRQLLDDIQIATTEQSADLDELERAMTSFEQLNVDELPRDIGDLQTVADFPVAHRDLDRIQYMLEKVRAPLRAALVARIDSLEKRFDTSLVDCRAQLDCGDLGTLSEEIEQIEKHGLAGSSGPTALDLLAQFCRALEAFGDRPAIDWGNLPKLIRDGGKLGPLSFGELTAFDKERADELIRNFIDLRRTFTAPARKSDKLADPKTRVIRESVKLLESLGWANVRLQNAKRETSWYQFSMSSVAFGDRDICPVPVFGSERLRGGDRRNHYALVVVDPDGAEACLTALDTLPDKVLLIFTDTLDYRLRRDVLRKTRRGTRSVAVADGVTIAMLAATPDRRLRQFFELAVAMGGAHPYADTGAETAIENFFGRQREINALVDPNGPSFVYGGRQLGKTALLKQIELRENANEDRVAVYCYIKAVGESEGADAVWEEVHSKLKERGVHLPARGATIADKLRGWVDEKAGRFLLIMLDEADAFLASEMEQNFPQIGIMKQLMESTKRGIKFVFAGLHNVQRFYRAPNSPLLHWGAPINVGPLLGSDRLAARQMALEPMAALGLSFERTIDAYHMLSLVGFYPSLMQSFGKAVVGLMNTRIAGKGEPSALPAVITRDVIESCFEDKTFRDSVTYRFQETLKLDERYELITYAVWDRMQDDSRGGRATTFGYSATEISRSARDWWPAGFAETESLESFTAILDEMVEMGVLARKSDHYALRSQRIAAMLGTKADIGNRLQNLIERAPRRRPDSLLSHRRIGSRWSPLTLRQEAALIAMLKAQPGPRIILISATPASGLGSLRVSVDALLTGPSVSWRSPRQLVSSNPRHIADAATVLRRDATPDAPGIVLVEGDWPDAETLRELRKNTALRESLRPVRVIICGSPKIAVLDALGEMPDIVHIQVGPLPLEGMLHWMNREQVAFADNEAAQARLRVASGGYLHVLETAQLDGPAKRMPDPLVTAVEASAAKVTLEQIALDQDLAAFGRSLLQAVGVEPVNANDVDVWAMEVGGDTGAEKLRQLVALGVVETAVTASETQQLIFNPLTARLLQ